MYVKFFEHLSALLIYFGGSENVGFACVRKVFCTYESITCLPRRGSDNVFSAYVSKVVGAYVSITCILRGSENVGFCLCT